jgi:hypothetical protein
MNDLTTKQRERISIFHNNIQKLGNELKYVLTMEYIKSDEFYKKVQETTKQIETKTGMTYVFIMINILKSLSENASDNNVRDELNIMKNKLASPTIAQGGSKRRHKQKKTHKRSKRRSSYKKRKTSKRI